MICECGLKLKHDDYKVTGKCPVCHAPVRLNKKKADRAVYDFIRNMDALRAQGGRVSLTLPVITTEYSSDAEG